MRTLDGDAPADEEAVTEFCGHWGFTPTFDEGGVTVELDDTIAGRSPVGDPDDDDYDPGTGALGQLAAAIVAQPIFSGIEAADEAGNTPPIFSHDVNYRVQLVAAD